MDKEKEDLEPLRQIRIHALLALKDDGRKHMLQCPFHTDRTPSFVLYPDNSYNCFGCEANGQNAIDFLLETGESFTDVVQELKKFITQ